MTMIACTLNNEAPIVLGDILISGMDRPDRFVVPSWNEDIITFLATDADYHPIRLKRKIYIPKKNVCIAFAGDVSEIKKFLEDLMMFCNINAEVNGPMLQKFVMEYGLMPEQNICFLLLIADIIEDKYRFLRIKYGPWDEIESELFGNIISAGSGSKDFVSAATEKAEFISALEPDGLDIAIQANLILICKLLSAERISLKHVKKHWGVGFELVYLIRKGFTRFENITYLINHSTFDADGSIGIPLPQILMHYSYEADYLIITAINPLNGETEISDDKIIIRYKKFNVKQFIVEPIHQNEIIDLSRLEKDTSFTSNLVAMGYILETKTGDFTPASLNVGSEFSVVYQHMELVTITIMRDMNDTIASLAKKWYEGNGMKQDISNK